MTPGDFKPWQFFQRFDINDPQGRLYLRRWRIVQTPWFGIYLHKIVQPDHDRDLHDHPYAFCSLVMWGGYEEQLLVDDIAQTSKRGLFSLAFRRSSAIHRIARLTQTPTWTLLLVGRRRKSWGFYTERGYVPWQRYLAEAKAARASGDEGRQGVQRG